MTREVVKKLLPIIKAFAEGKTIQFRTNNRSWVDLVDNNLEINVLFEYRIKPEPKYRPFKSQEECWEEMLKHQPFGWVKSKDKGYFHLIGLVQWVSEFEDVIITFATSEQLARSSRSMSENYIFADGTPFGIKEEQLMEEMWLSRDANNELYLFIDEVPPKKKREKWVGRTFSTIIEIPKRHFPEVQWSDDEPTKVKLVIEK